MSYNLELQKINLKLYSITNPDDKIILLKQAILLADSNNDLEWGIDFRLELINEEFKTSRCIESFPAFTWLLETYDKNPEIFDEKELLWKYKWLAQASYRNSNIEKEQIEKIFEDLKSRMTKNGYSLRGYYSLMIRWYNFIGDIEASDAYIELREKDTRDDMSHCMACELDIRVESELKKGNVDRAIDIVHDIFVKKLSCNRMPFATFCKFAYYLNKLGDSRAADFYEKAMYELKENIDEKYETFLSTISLLINYLIYNDREKAFELFEKYSPWDFNSEDSLQFDFSVNVLNLFNVEGSRKIRISATHPLYSDSGEYNLKDLYSYYYNRALDLAHKFDARNKTDNFKNLLTKETMSK